jgi:surface polysaccharide O-acyltransferase-like enzyme
VIQNGIQISQYNIFISLYIILGPYIVRAETNNRKVVRVDKAVAMILYKLAFGHIDRIIGQKFVQGLPYKDTT